MQFRKRSIVVDAFQLTAATRASNESWPAWATAAWQLDTADRGAIYPTNRGAGAGPLTINTANGPAICAIGDWIVRDDVGGVYPVKHDVFRATHEPAGVKVNR